MRNLRNGILASVASVLLFGSLSIRTDERSGK